MLAERSRPHVLHCLNCGAATPSRYCGDCGQEAVDAAVTFGNQVADFASEVGSVEARLPQTVAALIRRPGALTRAYNAGQRVRYVTPLKVYLFASVAFFLIASLGPHGQGIVQVDTGGGPVRVRSAEELEALLNRDAGVPPLLRAALLRLVQSPEGFNAALMDTLSKATLALVPIHALLLKAFYRRPPRLYGAHVVFSHHVHAFGYLAFALASMARVGGETAAAAANLIGLALVVVYVPLAARTAYDEGLVRSGAKALAIGAAYAVAIALVTFLAGVVAVLRI